MRRNNFTPLTSTALCALLLASGTLGRAGNSGAVIEGVGIGLVAIGALELAGA